MADKVVTEVEVVDRASKAFDDMSRAGSDLKSVLQGIGGAARASTPEAGRAASAFEKLYKTHVDGASAADRYDRAITKINRALSQNAVASTATATAEERVARLRAALSDQFEASERAIRGNVTAYDKLRNSIDNVSSAERAFAQGMETVNSALTRGEVDARRNAAEIARVTTALQDARRASLQQADAYTQIAERLNPLLKIERDHIAEVDAIRRAQEARRITDEQAEAQIAQLRAEVEKQTAEVNGSAEADRQAAKAAEQAALALERERAAYQALREEIEPALRVQREFNEATARVSAAAGRGDITGSQAATDTAALSRRRDAQLAALTPANIDQSAADFDRLRAAHDRLFAAEQKLAEGTATINRFLAEHPGRAAEAAAAQARLEQQFEETRRAIGEEASAFQRLDVQTARNIRADLELARAKRVVAAARASGEISARQELASLRELERAHGRALSSGDSLARGIGRINLAFHAGTALIAGFVGSLAIRKFIEFTDTMQRTENRLRVVVESTAELTKVQNELFASSQRSFTLFESGVEIYEKFRRSTKDLGVESERLLAVTETVQKSVALSGTTALAANAAIVQFGQGLAADSLRGQELNSVMEQMPRLARALAQGLGVSIGDLRQLANDGLLDTQKVLDALERSAASVEREFAKISPTVAQVANQTENAITKITAAFGKPVFTELKKGLLDFIGAIDDPEAIRKASEAGATLAKSFDDIANFADAAFKAALAFGAVKLVAHIAQVVAAGRAWATLSTIIRANPIGLAVTGAVAAFALFNDGLTEEERRIKRFNKALEDAFKDLGERIPDYLLLGLERSRKDLDAFTADYERKLAELTKASAFAPSPADFGSPAEFLLSGGPDPQKLAEEYAAKLQAMRSAIARENDELASQTIEGLGVSIDKVDALKAAIDKIDVEKAFDAGPVERFRQATEEVLARLADAETVTFEGVDFSDEDEASLRAFIEYLSLIDSTAKQADGSLKIMFASIGDGVRAAQLAADADFAAFLRINQQRLEALQAPEKTEGEKLKETAESRFARQLADPKNKAAIDALAAGFEAAEESSKKTADNADRLFDAMERAALKAREIADVERLIAAALSDDPDALRREEERIEIEKAVLRIRLEQGDVAADAEAKRLADLNEALRLEERIRRERERQQDRIQDQIGRGIDRAVRSPALDRGLDASSQRIRELARDRALEELARRRKEFEERVAAGDIGLTEERIEDMRAAFEDGAIEIQNRFEDAGDYVAQRITDAASDLAGSLIDDLIFNRGKGIGDILRGESRRDINDAFQQGLDELFSEDGDFGSAIDAFTGAIEESAKKFEKVGAGIDKVLGTDGVFSKLLAGAGLGFEGFQLGSGLAGSLVSGGGTGGKAGGAIGGGIGFAVAGPVGAFIGAAGGSFIGKILGSLFGRKTATGSIDFDTGELFDQKASKKDSRNERRDEILERSFELIQRLANVLDADLKNRIALEVKAGKSAISTTLIDPVTGAPILAGGKVGAKDVEGAIRQALDLALKAAIEGGDERLKRIATALSAIDIPAEKVLTSLESIASALEITKEPSSEFRDAIDDITDVFDDAIGLAERYAGAIKDIADAQVEALQAIAGKFDKTVADERRRLVDPIGQDAIELARTQAERLKDAKAINDALEAALATAARAASGQTAPAAGLSFQERFFRGDELGAFDAIDAAGAPDALAAANDNLAQSLDAATDAEKRLTAVIDLNNEEWKAFIQNASSSPEAFRAAAAAIDELKMKAGELGIDAAVLADALKDVRAGLAKEFDAAERKRGLSFTNPLQNQIEEIIDAQLVLIQAAKDVSSGTADQEARLARVFANNKEEFAKFIQSAGDAPDAIKLLVDALGALRERASEVGLTISQIDALQFDAVFTAGEAFLDKVRADFDRFTNAPVADFKALLEQQKTLTDAAKKFAELDPRNFGGLPSVVQNRNALERQKFLEALSDEDKLRLGDFVGLIEDYGGRIDVVTTQLRDVLSKATEGVEDKIKALDDTIESSTEFADEIAQLAFDLRQQFFPGDRRAAFGELEARLDSVSRDAIAGNESAQKAFPQLVAQFLDRAQARFGTSTEGFDAARDKAFSLLDQVEDAARSRAASAKTERDLLESQVDISQKLLDSFDKAIDNTAYLKQISESGELQNKIAAELVAQLIALREQQAGQDLSVVTRLASIDSAAGLPSNDNQLFAAPAPSAPPVFEDSPETTFARDAQAIEAETRQSRPDDAAAPAPTVAAQEQTADVASAQNVREIILALGALEKSLTGVLSEISGKLDDVKEEIRLLRQDQPRLNDELKAALGTKRVSLKDAA